MSTVLLGSNFLLGWFGFGLAQRFPFKASKTTNNNKNNKYPSPLYVPLNIYIYIYIYNFVNQLSSNKCVKR